MKKTLGIVAFLFLAACGGGGGGGSPDPEPPPPPEPTDVELFISSIQNLAIDDFYEVAYFGLLSRTPQTAVALGLETEAGLEINDLNNLSPAYQADTTRMFRAARDVLAGYDRSALSDADKINYDVFDWYLNDQIERAGFDEFGFPATYGNFGIPAGLQRFFSDVHPLESAADAQGYLDRLTAVDNQLSQLEAWILRQRDAGVVEPALTMQVAINQIDGILSTNAGDSIFFTRYRDEITDIPDLSTAQRASFRDLALNAVAGNVLPAYQRLRNTLQGLLASAPNDIGVGQYPGGDAYYAYELRHHTTTDLTPAEIHQIGLDELARIRAELETEFDVLMYPDNETLAETLDRVATDGGTVPAASGLQTFEDIIAAAEVLLPLSFDVLPSSDVVVKPDPFGGFYIGPSLDGSRPGAFFAGTENDQPFYLMPSLTYHESVPGHHMQIQIAADQDVPTFRKVVRNTGYVEGWALYAERLAFDEGWYDSMDGGQYANIGRLQWEALRAARLVLDTGIHDLGWTFDEAVAFNNENTGFSIGSSQGAAARYSISPGQATGYMIGMLRILEERERAETALGANFDLGAFHRAVLTAGAVPLDVLPTIVDAYIADAQAGP